MRKNKNKIYLDYLMEIYNSIIFDENNSSDKEIEYRKKFNSMISEIDEVLTNDTKLDMLANTLDNYLDYLISNNKKYKIKYKI